MQNEPKHANKTKTVNGKTQYAAFGRNGKLVWVSIPD